MYHNTSQVSLDNAFFCAMQFFQKSTYIPYRHHFCTIKASSRQVLMNHVVVSYMVSFKSNGDVQDCLLRVTAKIAFSMECTTIDTIFHNYL